ncbi:MAG: ATP-binding protein [Tannerella sp.]|nr:ATP-binding protein [Tannerella sp.]
MKRDIDNVLSEWKRTVNRKPLLLHGARQVGKTSAIREFAKQFDYFIEINFETEDRELNVRGLFKRGLTPRQMCDELARAARTPVAAGQTLLFFDEIQACLPALSLLTCFYSEYPELHVIAAGSLLSFALHELPLFGLGCIHSQYLYPLSFEEYLRAVEDDRLADGLREVSPEKPFPDDLHSRYIRRLTHFILAGGMPSVVAVYAGGGSWAECRQALDNLILAFYGDFPKYKHRALAPRLREVFASVIHQTGNKFNYSMASRGSNYPQIKECIKLLELAELIYPAVHTSADTFPLAAGVNAKFRKYSVLDTGIYHRFLRPEPAAPEEQEHLLQGASAELFVGLELLKAAPGDRPAPLYYWQDEKPGSQAEVEYVVQRRTDIVPVALKSETRDGRSSLIQFLSEKRCTYGVRCSTENFGVHRHVKNYPLYAAAQIGK